MPEVRDRRGSFAASVRPRAETGCERTTGGTKRECLRGSRARSALTSALSLGEPRLLAQVPVKMAAAELLRRYAAGERTFPALDLSGCDLSGVCLDGAFFDPGTVLTNSDLSGAQLLSARLPRVDLRGADLTGARLNSCILVMAKLQKAKLGADFTRAALDDADLSDADLTRADLALARLRRANLQRANLSDVDSIYGTDFAGATMDGAVLQGAHCQATIWSEVDLSKVEGLDALEHLGPSTIGVETLRMSSGKLPEAFLRGCGLSDWEIEAARLYDPSLSNEQINDIHYRLFALRAERPFQVSPLFVSYSWHDALFVDALGAAFDKKGIRYWRDKKDGAAGPLDEIIDRAMRLNPTVVVVLSKHSVDSVWVEHEIEKAIALSRELGRHVLCPIALDDSWYNCRLSGQLQTQLRKYNIISFDGWQDGQTLEAQLLKVLEGLQAFYSPKSV